MLGDAAGELGHERAQARPHQAEAVILRRDLHAPGKQVHDGLVATAMPELELLHGGAAGQADHLVPQADTEDGHASQQLLHLLVGNGDGIRVARTVGEEDAVRLLGEHLGSRRVPRHHRELATRAHESLEDAALDAAVVGHHAAGSAALARGHEGEVMLLGQVGRRVGEGRGTAHRGSEVLAYQVGCLVHTRTQGIDGPYLGGDDALLGAMIAQVPHEGARVYALDRHDAPALQVLRQGDAVTPARRRGAHVAHHHAAECGARGGVRRHRKLGVRGIDAVVADLRVRHRHDLARVARVRQHLEVALKRRVETDLAHRGALGAARTAMKNGPVLQHQDCRTAETFTRSSEQFLLQ